jgi:hypothetical protein
MTVAPLVAVGDEHASRVAPAPHVRDHHRVATGREIAEPLQGLLVAGRLGVGRARENDGEAAGGIRAVDVGRERDTVAHRDAAVEFELDLVHRLRRRGVRLVRPCRGTSPAKQSQRDRHRDHSHDL